jgi:uncharacterized protein YwqG
LWQIPAVVEKERKEEFAARRRKFPKDDSSIRGIPFTESEEETANKANEKRPIKLLARLILAAVQR